MMQDSVSDTYLLETLKSLKGLKSTAEKAIEQITDDELFFSQNEDSNSVAILIKHISGNMKSRFTDFLISDGEKSWRNRDGEFTSEKLSRENLFERWNEGWECLFNSIQNLNAGNLLNEVVVSGEKHTVLRALNRQLVHYAYHTGQIVYLCKEIRGSEFKTLSIPKNKFVS